MRGDAGPAPDRIPSGSLAAPQMKRKHPPRSGHGRHGRAIRIDGWRSLVFTHAVEDHPA
jgi:hypothetical protein